MSAERREQTPGVEGAPVAGEGESVTSGGEQVTGEGDKAAKRSVDITQTDELGRTKGARAMSIAAWAISGLVVLAGIIALVVTGKRIFILFIVIGILMPLNVLLYDNLILKPKVARLKKEKAELAASDRAAAATDKENDQ